FSFAHHFSARNTEAALALYRERFTPSDYLDRPHVMVAVRAIVADTDERAEYLARPGLISFLQLRAGKPAPVMHPDRAAQYEFSPAEAEFVRDRGAGQLLGSPETVTEQLADL